MLTLLALLPVLRKPESLTVIGIFLQWRSDGPFSSLDVLKAHLSKSPPTPWKSKLHHGTVSRSTRISDTSLTMFPLRCVSASTHAYGAASSHSHTRSIPLGQYYCGRCEGGSTDRHRIRIFSSRSLGTRVRMRDMLRPPRSNASSRHNMARRDVRSDHGEPFGHTDCNVQLQRSVF